MAWRFFCRLFPLLFLCAIAADFAGRAILHAVHVIGEFKHLSFDDAADAIQVGAALPFKIGRVFRLFAKKKEKANASQHSHPCQR